MIKNKVNELIYDIETLPLWYRGWRLGEQAVRHGQLVPVGNTYGIICITYALNNDPVKCLTFDINTGDCSKVIEEFDTIVKKADVVIGKNSDRFDIKHINSQRLMNNLPPFPEWADVKDDVESQLRRFFILPSYSLDYISKMFGMGGKVKMDWSDWEDIDNLRVINQIKSNHGDTRPAVRLESVCVTLFNTSYSEIKRKGIKALKKMCFYGKKDTADTRKAWHRIKAYVKPKFNAATAVEAKIGTAGRSACCVCGSVDIIKNGTRVYSSTVKQQWRCKTHKGYAGRCTFREDKKTHKIIYGKMGL